jgi:hypothetical protein
MTRNAFRRKTVDDSRALQWLSRSSLFRLVYFGPFFTSAGAPGEIEKRFAGVLADTVKPSFERRAQLSRAHHFEALVSVFPLFRGKKAETFEGHAFASGHATSATMAALIRMVDVDREAIADDVGRMHTAVKS